MRLELGHRPADTPAERTAERAIAWEAPRLPGVEHAMVPRWSAGPTWTPPGTILLVRHRSADGGRCIVTNDRRPPEGYEIEYDLGLVHAFAQPGTQRLIATDDGFFRTPFEGGLADGLRGLGYVEEAPLPLLDALELRRDPASGQPTLVAGPDDPLHDCADTLGHLGFVESFPLNPRHTPDLRVERHLDTLLRRVDAAAWRHRYAVGDRRHDDAVALGGVWQRSCVGFVELLQLADGTLTSELCARCEKPRRSLRDGMRWAGAPLAWNGPRPRAWALRAAASRTRRLVGTAAAGSVSSEVATVLGYVASDPIRGWSPIFSALHPVLGDQYVTRSELEAGDLGYVVEGILGYVADRRADRVLGAMPPEVKWASRFGRRRRYIEGSMHTDPASPERG